MSFFGGNAMQSQQAVNPQNIAMAEQELEMVTDLFNRWVFYVLFFIIIIVIIIVIVFYL